VAEPQRPEPTPPGSWGTVAIASMVAAILTGAVAQWLWLPAPRATLPVSELALQFLLGGLLWAALTWLLLRAARGGR
jgi:hypothetical protein